MPAGAADQFDPTVFKAEFTTEMTKLMNDTVNGAIKSMKTDFQKLIDAVKPPEIVPPTTVVDPPPTDAKTIAELNAQVNAMKANQKATEDKIKASEDKAVAAETARLEQERISSFDSIISSTDFIFATDKAKRQFRDAYLPKVARDETGNLIIKGDDGTPMEMATFLKTEYTESTHMQPATGRGGSGAVNGTQRTASAAKPFNYRDDMTPAEINALPADQKAAYRQSVNEALLATINA